MNGNYSNVSPFPKRKTQPFEVFCPVSWSGVEPEPIKWLVRGCIPRGTVCLFSGDSGLGKSLLMQQLQTAAATGSDWLGFNVDRVRSFGFYCEDPKTVLHWRQREICKSLGIDEGDLEDMSIAARVGLDNVLMDFNRRTDEGRATPVYDQLRSYARDFGAELVIVDTAAHTFNGNENVRAHVTAFVNILQEIASETGGAVVLCSHPSVSSMQSGSGYSGSTAWRATVRAHMYLKRPKGYDDESDDADPDIRVLKTMKSNWGPGTGVLRLKWDDGVFVPIAPERKRVSGAIEKLTIDRAILDGVRYLVKRGDRIAAESMARNNLVVMVGRLPSCASYTRPDIEAAADRLFEDERLIRVPIGPPSKRRLFIRTEDTNYPEEEG
ncbi:MAG TPA: AAA family ATPase [Bryobacteraceae bacterium]|nr:AAA family ATPase [Bryobacteraceae bacterium]